MSGGSGQPMASSNYTEWMKCYGDEFLLNWKEEVIYAANVAGGKTAYKRR